MNAFQISLLLVVVAIAAFFLLRRPSERPTTVAPLTIQFGPIQHAQLPEELVARVRAFKLVFADVYPQTHEQWLEGFQRDVHPENEIAVWEHIAAAFSQFIVGRSLPLEARREAFGILLVRSGCTDEQALSTPHARRYPKTRESLLRASQTRHSRNPMKSPNNALQRTAPHVAELGVVRRHVAIALLDVDYREVGARAACVLATSWVDAEPTSQHSIDIRSVEAYEPGNFYRRELPCLLEVLSVMATKPSIAVVDGYVWLEGEARPGLGFHLYEALDSKIPVIGIAKTAFAGAVASAQTAKVFRGESKRPLFVTAVGVELSVATDWVQSMAGAHRIPSLVAAVDRLARSEEPARQNAA